MRLINKVAIVTGAGQTPGETIGNGRATAILFAREGARVFLTDRNLVSVEETKQMILDEGGEADCFEMDVASEADCEQMVKTCVAQFGRIDVLHNNVGIGANDGGVTRLTHENWQHILNVNLTSMFLTCKHVVPVMREQQAGNIINISSVAAIASTGMLAYKTSKAGILALTENVAMGNAKYGIRANCIMPGLMNTPMAIEGYSAVQGRTREDVIAARDKRVPLGSKMGTAWDVAYAALFLASDEAKFITGVTLPVDGGQSIRVG
ncbi:MAG: SDR family NAD(P)-dependent oxidoreductase [Pseudomonadales bacterium]|jgi:NAD(P)-dependent dehydrogenase (short-subunit alcohol dehydrogenase family)|nr:3-oxoacyl-ACP reductase [Gammaproteobacteria bacterium]MDP6024628.1 SDR family NAD(P)-dependent oxidoreductase [Pseudomonadales bacterium]MDP6316737.1 SDR family NAD(P)-dependent oxidoreductase [Pseudomonadales bacterium]MDP7313497.1 SDR family NAD(P)-dependent oxidoreductase [Pseudomonadales bacterium]MDP7577431.1 SDR family NAD(P)-dependent oxidoreductase [Pseudomonadales bacterium]|tara:strand:- start:763 stop:1557 length:795 start_codon:yes stop_codon:yes gene_type:complete